MGSKAATPKGQPAKKSRQAVSKRSHGSASKGEPIPKKARRESEAEASMPKVVPSSVEEQGNEEEEEEEVPVLRSRGLRSRGPVILEEGKLAGEPVVAEEVERPKLTWWGGMTLRFRESKLSPGLLQFMREGLRCNSLGLPVY